MLESISGFFTLGARHFMDMVKLFSLGFEARKVESDLQEAVVNLARKSWELDLLTPKSHPVLKEIQKYEASITENKQSFEEITQKVNELRESRKQHLAHYESKLTEQLQLKRPVDNELTSLLVEIKRMKREYSEVRSEINNLGKKIQIQNERLEKFKKSGQDSNQYLSAELSSEVKLNERNLALDNEKLNFLTTNIEEGRKQTENIRKVLQQFEDQITDLRTSQQAVLDNIGQNIGKLLEQKRGIDRQLRKIGRELRPVLSSLGQQIANDRIESNQLAKKYEQIDHLESEKDRIQKETSQLRSEINSISTPLKVAFYGLILSAVVVVIVGLVLFIRWI